MGEFGENLRLKHVFILRDITFSQRQELQSQIAARQCCAAGGKIIVPGQNVISSKGVIRYTSAGGGAVNQIFGQAADCPGLN